MSRTFPIEIRRHYTIRERPRGWRINCDQCGQETYISKPFKEVSTTTLLTLLNHIHTHDPISTPSLPEEKIYAVCQVGDQTVATSLMDEEEEIGVVQQVEKGVFLVYVLAANIKHARVMAQGMFNRYLAAGAQKVRSWRNYNR